MRRAHRSMGGDVGRVVHRMQLRRELAAAIDGLLAAAADPTVTPTAKARILARAVRQATRLVRVTTGAGR